MNTNIISEFEKLVNFIQFQIDECKKIDATSKECVANQFRLSNISNSLAIIKKYPSPITIDNLKDFKQPGIGKGTLDRIKEILEKGKLSELKNFKDISNKEKEILEELESIVGIGKSLARKFYDAGITSIKDLKKKIKSGEIEVNDKILLGIKYHGKFEGNIPRQEINEVYEIIQSIINKLNKKLDNNERYIFEICGSYRREKPTSGDIDILISKLNVLSNDNDNINHLKIFIDKLKENIKSNNNHNFSP